MGILGAGVMGFLAVTGGEGMVDNGALLLWEGE